MTTEKKTISVPEKGVYKDHAVLSIPLLDGKNKEGIRFTFGLRKAKAMLDYYGDIQNFVKEENELKQK